MSDFAVKIEDGYATATHHASGHVFEFLIAPEPPYLRCGAVRENRKAIGVRTVYGEPRKTPFSRKHRRPV
jgi:hypothetical protein